MSLLHYSHVCLKKSSVASKYLGRHRWENPAFQEIKSNVNSSIPTDLSTKLSDFVQYQLS